LSVCSSRFIVDRYFKDEPMDDVNKMLFAFASYNAGPARVSGLRNKAANMGLYPNVWFHNVEVVAAKEIGRETLQYVSNTYKYYFILTRITALLTELYRFNPKPAPILIRGSERMGRIKYIAASRGSFLIPPILKRRSKSIRGCTSVAARVCYSNKFGFLSQWIMLKQEGMESLSPDIHNRSRGAGPQ